MTEIKKLWQLISINSDSILELRAIWPKGVQGHFYPITEHFRVAEYVDINACMCAFEQRALELNACGYNIYTVMNPIRTDFEGKAARDADIVCRKILLIDIDRVGNTNCPANDTELKAACDLSRKIQKYLDLQGWASPIRVMSGNGYHLYYELCDLTNNESNAEKFALLLKKLASKFSNDVVSVDTTVSNASRITKVVGTVARKGIESEGRPYRMAVICDE